jgi:hypothetical protein
LKENNMLWVFAPEESFGLPKNKTPLIKAGFMFYK